MLMFGGEALCLVAYFLLRLRKRIRRQQGLEPPSMGPKPNPLFFLHRSLIFSIPSLIDAVGATVLNLGLYYTFASVFQMLRGTLVLFAALFTLLFLRRRLYMHHWLGVTLISAGAAIVGAASVIQSHSHPSDNQPPSHQSPPMPSSILQQGISKISDLWRPLHGEGNTSASAPLFGDLLVIIAQSLSAFQFIMEEKLLSNWRVQPLLAVGLEGVWGLVICTLSLPFLPYVTDQEGKPLDDLIAATNEVLGNPNLLNSAVVSVLCIGAFNFCGLSVTKALSGANRASIDACRTLFVWLVALYLGWETFKGLQLIGFFVLISGSCLFNEVLRGVLPQIHPADDEEEEEEDLEDGAADDKDLTAPLLRPRQGKSQRSLADSSASHGASGSSARLGGRISGSGSEVAAGVSASPWRIKQQTPQKQEYSMARSLICGLGTLEPKDLAEGGTSVEEDADLSAPFDVSSVKDFGGLMSQRIVVEAVGSSNNARSSSSGQIGMKKSRSLSQMLADEAAEEARREGK